MSFKEITAQDLKPNDFINEQVANIKNAVGNGLAINALSGGVDSSVATILAHRALGEKGLKTYFIQNGLMREDEESEIIDIFDMLGVPVDVVYAEDKFFAALGGIEDPEEKREAVTQTFYKDIFGRLVRESGATHLLQGTNLTDIEETVAGIKRQHNVFVQMDINPEEAFGYKILEPLVELRKDGIRLVASALDLPDAIAKRPPFPGPALATRVIEPVTRENIELVRKATVIVEKALWPFNPFQVMAILQSGKVTGVVNNERRLGYEIQVRCWESIDARIAKPMAIPHEVMFYLGEKIPEVIPEVVSVTWGVTSKPPSTMEAL